MLATRRAHQPYFHVGLIVLRPYGHRIGPQNHSRTVCKICGEPFDHKGRPHSAEARYNTVGSIKLDLQTGEGWVFDGNRWVLDTPRALAVMKKGSVLP